MSMTVDNDYLRCLLQSASNETQDTLDWLKHLRAQALDRAGQLRFPTQKDEAWRFTDISPLARLPYQPAQPKRMLQLPDIQQFIIAEASNRLVFVDGFFTPELSLLDSSDAYFIGNLSLATSTQDALIATHLGKHVQFGDNIFAALNTAFINDGAIIRIPDNSAIHSPIHLLFIATQSETTSYPRCLVVAGANSQATVIEDYVALQDNGYITNSVAEFDLAANAQIRHFRVQRENNNAFHLANCAVSLEHASHYQTVNITFGAAISRFNLDVAFKTEAAECTIDGLTMITGTQLADTHTSIDHLKPHCTSRQQHKCIVDDSAHAVFNGQIVVRPHAQRTNSSQSSRNLLLSSNAQIDTKPQLEIFADDVKCAHGATVGQLDNEEIFYLKSRGLSEISARNLLTYAFGAEILDGITVPSFKQMLEQIVLNQTQNGQAYDQR